jgi:hypothetical protein
MVTTMKAMNESREADPFLEGRLPLLCLMMDKACPEMVIRWKNLVAFASSWEENHMPMLKRMGMALGMENETALCHPSLKFQLVKLMDARQI